MKSMTSLLGIRLSAITVVFSCFTATAAQAQEDFALTLSVGEEGLQREIYVDAPIDMSSKRPLFIALHGYGDTAKNFMETSGLDILPEEAGAYVVFPQGEKDRNGRTHWNAMQPGLSDIDDFEFMLSIIETAHAEWNTDPEQVFIVGFSNGGYMAYAMGCHHGDLLAGIASVGGTMSGTLYENCPWTDPLTVLQIHGTADTSIPFDGVPGPKDTWGGAPGMRTILGQIGVIIGAQSEGSRAINEKRESVRLYDTPTGHFVDLEVFLGGGHQWFRSEDPVSDTPQIIQNVMSFSVFSVAEKAAELEARESFEEAGQ